MKNLHLVLAAFALLSVTACGGAPPPNAGSPAAATLPNAGSSAEAAVKKPDVQATKAHLVKHVTYPATRSEILAACADTPEFSAEEKRWFEQNIPEAKYESAEQVISALKL